MTLLVIDGNSIVNRAYFGIKQLTTKSGFHTNAVYGFLKMLQKFEEACSPTAVAVAFDVHEPTFRHKMCDGYKAGRRPMDEELKEQIPRLKELLRLLGYKTLECPGWEADDIMGTLAAECRREGEACFLATGDRDALQLAHDGVKVLLARTKAGAPQTDVYDEERILAEYGVSAEALIQVKGLQGDPSDKIPGVAGVGEKTAQSLVQKFGTIDYIYENIDTIDVKENLREKLRKDKDNAYLSLALGTISDKAPVSLNLDDYKVSGGDKTAAAKEFLDLEFFSLLDSFGLNADDVEAEEKEEEKAYKKVTVEEAGDVLTKLSGNVYVYPITEENSILALYIPVGGTVYEINAAYGWFYDFLKQLFTINIKIYTVNSKLFYRLAYKLGVECNNIFGDLLLSAYLLNPSDSKYSTEKLAMLYHIKAPTIPDDMGESDEAAAQAVILEPLFEKTAELLKEANETDLLNKIELPLARVLGEMEMAGFEVDRDGINDFGKKLSVRIKELTSKIYKIVGHEFNINSPKQLGVVLFEEMGIPAKKKTKSGYSTKAEILEELAPKYPVVELILEYRSLSKLKSTYCDGLLKVIAEDGRIHTSFNQVETRTGRISSLEPNLQNIPVRTDLGREMRKFFRAKDGCVLIDADYSQIELRVLASLSNDENMITAFNTGVDIHKTTASQVFGLPVEMVTPQLRSRAKAVNFGIVYGIGAFSLAKDIGVSVREAQAYIDGYLEKFSGVANYMTKMIELARERGYAETLFNRRRYLPELTSSNHQLRSFGERVARNMPIQGTAADIIKIAMVRVDEKLKAGGFKAKLILQVHDELIVEAPENEAEAVLELVKTEMQNACKMQVELLVDAKIGKTWYEAH